MTLLYVLLAIFIYGVLVLFGPVTAFVVSLLMAILGYTLGQWRS